MSELFIKQRTLKTGKTVYEYAFEIASVNGKRKRKTKSGFATKREAREAGKLAQQTYENTGQAIESSDISYSDFIDQWMKNDIKITCKAETVKGYEKKIRLYIKPNLGSYKLNSITKDQLQQFLLKMFNDGFSLNTISSIRGLLTKSFAFAVDRRYILSSPAIGLKTPRNILPEKKTRQKPHEYITQEQMNKIFERFPISSSSHIPLMLAYHCGFRLGELFALTWDDVDFDNRTISVNKQVQWKQNERSKEDKQKNNGTSNSNGFWYFSEPKYKSYRTVDIDDNLFNLLKNEKEKQFKAKEYYAEYYKHYYAKDEVYYRKVNQNNIIIPAINEIGNTVTPYEVNFICRRDDGSYISPRTMQHVSNVIHNQLNIKGYDTHSLRHTHATMLMENGVDMVYIQHRLGHKDINVTMNIYTNHITEKIQIKNNNVLNSIYN